VIFVSKWPNRGIFSFVGFILLTKSLLCYVAVIIRNVVYFRVFITNFFFKMFKEDSVQIPTQRSRISCPSKRPSHASERPSVSRSRAVQGCIRPAVMATRPNALQSSRKFSFPSQTRSGKTAFLYRHGR
jgi:hypothetical protein